MPAYRRPGCAQRAFYGAACVTVKVWPASVAVPVRSAPGFAAAVNDTVPLPVAVSAETVSQLALDDAVHVQVLADAVTATVPAPPAPATLADAGAIEGCREEAEVPRPA